MSNFFQTSDGEQIKAEKEYSTGGDLDPIPKGTIVLAAPYEAKRQFKDDFKTKQPLPESIGINWTVLAPPEYKNRKIFQDIKVNSKDPVKEEKAKRMLAAIDANAGGKLAEAGEYPTDSALATALVNKPMLLKLTVWVSEDKSASGNWVMAVSPRNKEAAAVETPATDFDDDIPF
jgi:hypothetical protein